MNRNKLILVSLGAALFALLLVFSYLGKREKELLQFSTPVKVLVAVKDIPEDAALDETLAEVAEAPKKFAQPGAMTDPAEVFDRVTAVPILKGAQITDAMLRPVSAEGVARRVPADRRAYSIAATEVTAVAGLLRPGDQVDVLVTAHTGTVRDGRQMPEGTIARTLLHGILVLAVNKVSQAGTGRGAAVRQQAEGSLFSGQPGPAEARQEPALRTLTLALTPEEVQQVALAQEIGSLSVSLRSPWAKGESPALPNVNAQQVLGTERPVMTRNRPSWTEIRGSEEMSGR